MKYYHSQITQKSWEELKRLKSLLDFILIGGWAVYLYTKSLKSKDVDIIIEFDKIFLLKRRYDVSKNDRLKKYEARLEEIQIDVYLPYYSQIGIPVEDLIKHTQNLQGFCVLDQNYLAALKIYILAQRGRSPKGRKDFLDLISLLKSKIVDLEKVKEITKKYKLIKEFNSFHQFLEENYDIPELSLNKHNFAKFKKSISVFFPRQQI